MVMGFIHGHRKRVGIDQVKARVYVYNMWERQRKEGIWGEREEGLGNNGHI